jgi:hypothetical protein
MAKPKPVEDDCAEALDWAGEAAEALTGADLEVDAKVREAVIARSDVMVRYFTMGTGEVHLHEESASNPRNQ